MTSRESGLVETLNASIRVGNALAEQIRERDALIEEQKQAIENALAIIRIQKETIRLLEGTRRPEYP